MTPIRFDAAGVFIGGVTADIVPWNDPMQIIGRSVGAAPAVDKAWRASSSAARSSLRRTD